MAEKARAAAALDTELLRFAEAAGIVASASRDPRQVDPESFGAAAGLMLEECGTRRSDLD